MTASSTLVSLVLLATLLAPPQAATPQGQPGDLDPAFGAGGSVAVDLAFDSDEARGVAVQSDGRIVMAGLTGTYPEGDFVLTRHTTEGALDRSFGEGGIVLTDFGSTHDLGQALAIQADGRIVAVGSSQIPDRASTFAVARYQTDGSLDPSFGQGGEVLTDVGPSSDDAQAVAIQPDGKIVVAGSVLSQNFTDGSFGIVRYNTDGSLDGSFGAGGIVVVGFDSFLDAANVVLVQPDGRIVAVGTVSRIDGTADFGLARLNANGSLDTSFSRDGKVTSDFSGLYDGAYGGALQADGKIVAGGFAAGQGFALARYTANGQLDPSFGGDGKVTTDSGMGSIGALVIQPDGNILAAGSGQGDLALCRYLPDGTLDPAFGDAGRVFTDIADDQDEAHAVTLDPQGRIVAAGMATRATTDLALARYDAAGSPDVSFGGDGETVVDFDSDTESADAVAVDAQDRVVLAGTWGADFAIVRLGQDGLPDVTFGTGGLATLDFPLISDTEVAHGVRIQPNGKIVAAGTIVNQLTLEQDFAVARFDPAGSPDPTFGVGGAVRTDLRDAYEEGRAVALQADGRILVAGWARGRMVVVRYRGNGRVDRSFGGRGIVFGPPGFGEAVAVQADGKVLVAGSRTHDPYALMAVWRLNSDGTTDTTFGTGGVATSDFGGWASAAAVVVQSDGKIVAAGSRTLVVPGDFALARYNVDGTPDTTFGSSGLVTTDFLNDDEAFDVLLQSDGRIVAIGTAVESRTLLALARYAADGSLDPTFGDGEGLVLTDLGYHDQEARGGSLDGEGRIVVGGFATRGARDDFASARYLGG